MANHAGVVETVQITFRVPKSWIEDAKVVAQHMSQPGFEASYTDALRAAIAKGLASLRTQHGIKSPSESKRKRKS